MLLPEHTTSQSKDEHVLKTPSITLPNGGGAIRGMGEKFASNPVTGTGSMSVPIATSPGRSGFGPQLSLSYDSGAGNGPFGLGWNLSLPSITRKTDKGLPRYHDAPDAIDSDVFILSGAEDLVPVLKQDANGKWIREQLKRTVNGVSYHIRRYRPRVEGLFARIERWTNEAQPSEIFWRSISKENITTWYGRTDNSRITDPTPDHSDRVFSWLICQSHDDKGNVISYQYKAENADQLDLSHAHEQNRGDEKDKRRTANRYLKRIYYGNHSPYLPELQADKPWPEPSEDDNNWYFEVVFDYGEHDETHPTSHEAGQWKSRCDPFSSNRSTFEIRTYRLCKRVLMFHHIPDDPNGHKGYEGLVRSTDFSYKYEKDGASSHTPVYSKLIEITQRGYQRSAGGDYLASSLPPLEFTYSEAMIQTELREIPEESLEDLPFGIDGTSCQWIDLDGEGLSGMLFEQANAWFYKRNLSPLTGAGGGRVEAKLAPAVLVTPKPMISLTDNVQFLDLAGDGLPDAVQFSSPMPGFYERTVDEKWDSFVPFTSLPNVNWNDPNLKFIDLDGDGHADILISEHDAFIWHRSLGEAGFDSAQRTSKCWDEEMGPHIIFADAKQSIYVADLTGDGLSDIVRIRNDGVCYWPNLGFGRFGAKVTMDNAPLFDHTDQFSNSRIRLADIDGTGTTDILYLHLDGVRVYFNHSGKSWSAPTTIQNFPVPDNVASVQVFDLLGNGTACLVWSSPRPVDARRSLRYLDLMGGQKPHLLVKTVNNLGAETTVEYAPSTMYYLLNEQEDKPWITKLPFPVHCVEKVTVCDSWRQTRFTTAYSYHHGYFDGAEREFRGFGRVEQIDVEDYGEFAKGNSNSPYIADDHTLYQPPVKTITWYHTGAFLDRERTLKLFKDEYCTSWIQDEGFNEKELPEPDLDSMDLTADEWREALRACKGMVLRQEVFELDVKAMAGSVQEPVKKPFHKPVKLFSTAFHNCHIHLVQPKADNTHAVFHVTESEAITYHYELELLHGLKPDPRISHTLNLSIDEYGNIQQSVSVVYPRLIEYTDDTLNADVQHLIRKVQSETHLIYSERRYTNDVPNAVHPDPDDYRLRLPYEVLTYELTGELKTNTTDRYFTLEELREYKLSDIYQNSSAAVKEVAEIAYHKLPDRISPQKRIVEHTRTLFFDKALNKPLALRELNALALPYESYKLALTGDILDIVFADKITPDVQATLTDKKYSGYLTGAQLAARFGANTTGQYWKCSGIAGFNEDAPNHFYLPERYTDPFDNITTLSYDSRDLYIQSSTDALDNRTEVTEFDCRVLAPCRMKDANDNVSEVRFDILGMPAAIAVMGKGDEADSLNDFNDDLLNLDLDTRHRFFVNQDYDAAIAKNLLRGASTRYVYYFGEVIDNGNTVWGRYPSCVSAIIRERHVADEPDSPIQCGFEYSDGMGNVLVKKTQAEPERTDGALRWVASGKTIQNNKGKPVKQYEPYFSAPSIGHRFEHSLEAGVTPVMFYDAVGRVIRTDSPDGSYSRVEFSPWHANHYDANDTVSQSDNRWFVNKSAPTASEEDRRAAQLAAEHADTPLVSVLDSLGREVVKIAHNRMGPANALVDEKYVTYTKLDAEGKPLWVQDARSNRVVQYIMPPLLNGVDDSSTIPNFTPCYDIAGNLLYQHSMDAGDRWMLNDAAGKPMFAWNSRSHVTRLAYDRLHRPIGSYVTGADPNDPTREIQYEKKVYGEEVADNKRHNLRGKLYALFDTAGVVTNESYDFRGNLLSTKRQLALDYKTTPDWSQNPALEEERFVARTRYDAQNRPVQIIAPHLLTAAATQRICVTQLAYNEAGLLDRVDLWLNQSAEPTTLLAGNTANQRLVKNINYNAKGQRVLVQYGNESETSYDYEPDTFRLKRLKTKRNPDHAVLQELNYTYDPVGNITRIFDDAQDRVFHSNQCVQPSAEYRYDALYRLIAASGREHRGNGQQLDWDDRSRFVPVMQNDCQALQNYVETYRYDEVGNIMQMVHHTGSNLEQPGQAIWNRRYQYALDSNRLLSTSVPGDPINSPGYNATPVYSVKYTYDAHGNITAMPHLPQMNWDFKDQLSATTGMVTNTNDNPQHAQLPATTYYVYDASGQRVRKVTTTQTGAPNKQRIYLGGFEVYREYSNGTVKLERESLHVMDDKQHLALIETQTIKDQSQMTNVQPLVRYQLGNHLGSTSLELDENGEVITYEEYTPFGSTAYCAGRSASEVSLKRYRYTGKERDEETGLSYHGARYYAPWLGRWMSCDPNGISDGSNIYRYVRGNPTIFVDLSGRTTTLNLLSEDMRDQREQELKKQADDPYVTEGVSKEEVADAMNLKNGDMIEKYGWNRRGQIFDAMSKMSLKDLARALPEQDKTVYWQPSGRQATNSQEQRSVLADKVENFNPGTPIGGIVRTAAYAAGASHEEAERIGAVGDLAEGLLPAATAGVARYKAASAKAQSTKPITGARNANKGVGTPTSSHNAGKNNSVNPPDPSTGEINDENCVPCTAATLKNVNEKSQASTANNIDPAGLMKSVGRAGQALKFVANATGMQYDEKPVDLKNNKDALAAKSGHYVIIARTAAGGHMVYAQKTDSGSFVIYDGQHSKIYTLDQLRSQYSDIAAYRFYNK
ncbi:SpvB/TcaC N-terminal domain-containing protein [Cohnella silvisoli]|uniref:SpvB/TcaC N-terminal domain-containing protein n=1 Tax=Cohnella silvisoli TaxID=2873699 RepID=A0ABV1L1G4_9BACL|nr:SpvB/TcaC N-terminal domain-containing protein [Cohnella silvisoli]MCD9025516.1 hypothetical protein [Cohnella silvisoli]